MLKSKRMILKKNEFYEEFKRVMCRLDIDGINPTIPQVSAAMKLIFAGSVSEVLTDLMVRAYLKRFLYKGWAEKTTATDNGNTKYRIMDQKFVKECKRTCSIVSFEIKYRKRMERLFIEAIGRSLTEDDIFNAKEDIRKKIIIDEEDKIDDKKFEAEQKESEKLSL